MAATALQTVGQLREEIRRIEGRPPRHDATFVSSGHAEVDTLLGRGFPRGQLCELAGARASGKTALALSTLSVSTRDGLAAFVDGRHELYPPAASALGVALDRLLIVRPGERGEGDHVHACLWAAEALLGSGAFETVVMDVPVGEALLDAVAFERVVRRLRSAAEKGSSAGLWLGTPGRSAPGIHLRLEISAGPGAEWNVVRVRGSGSDAGPRDGGVRLRDLLPAANHAA
jgi:protein ImuA